MVSTNLTTNGIDDHLVDLIKCFNCSRVYDEPKLLPCGYTICKSCCQAMDNKSHIFCKRCDVKHHVQLDDLKTNQDMLKLINSIKLKQEAKAKARVASSSRFQLDDSKLIDDYNSYLKMAMNEKLNVYVRAVRDKIETINDTYEKARNKIEDDCRRVSNEINASAQNLIDLILEKKFLMLKDVENRKAELLIDFKERYENNKKVVEFRNEINDTFNSIMDQLSDEIDMNEEKIHLDDFNSRLFIEKLQLLNSKIDDHVKYIPFEIEVGISFMPPDQAHDYINIPIIGDVNYDCIYKIDIIAKVRNLNNKFQHRLIDLNGLIIENPISKHFRLISKNKVLLIYEKLFGKIKSLFVKIIYYDGTILKEIEIKNVGTFMTFSMSEKQLVIIFRKSKRDLILQLYELMTLKLEKELFINYEVNSMWTNDERIYLLRDHEPYVYEYDYELQFREAFGQLSKEKRPWYIKGEIFSLNNEKIYLKLDNSIRTLSQKSGELLTSLNVPDLKESNNVYLDYNKEKYLVFNGYNKILYYNHKGELLITNKLRYNENYDEFQYTKTGHFAFINYTQNTILTI